MRMILVLVAVAAITWSAPGQGDSAAALVAEYESKLPRGKKDLPIPLFHKYRMKLAALGRAATPSLASVFDSSKNWRVRYLVVAALARIKDPASIPVLIRALDDKTILQHSFSGMGVPRSARYRIRQEAADALKAIGPPAVEELLGILLNGRSKSYENVVYALSVIATPAAIEPLALIAMSQSEPAPARRDAIQGIARGGARDVQVLAELLQDASVRRDVVEILEKTRNKHLTPVLAGLIHEGAAGHETARAAAGILWKKNKKKWKPGNLKDQVDYLLLAGRGTSIAGAIRQKALSRLAYWVESKNREMRSLAIKALGGFSTTRRNRNIRAGDILLGLLEHSDKDVRLEAVYSLRDKRDYRVMESLIYMLAAEDGNQKKYMSTLRCWTGQDFGLDIEGWLAWWQRNRSTFKR